VHGFLTLAAIVGALGIASAHTELAPGGESFAPAAPAAIAPTGEAQIAPANGQPQFDAARAWSHLQKQVAFGPRPAASAALKACRDYLIAELKKLGIEPRQQAFVARTLTPAGDIPMVNLIATIPGTRAERIIIASHYDTKRAPNFKFVGASDGASSTAALLELARVLKARQNEFTIELLFLDGEEAVKWNWDVNDKDHTYGSRHYVEELKKANAVKDVRAFILIDMIADRDLGIRREQYSTAWLTDAVWSAAKRLNRREFLDEATPIEDDHLEFLEAGIPSVDIIDLDYPQWHQPTDDLAHVSVKSVQAVGDVVVAALPAIEKRLTSK